MKNTRVTKSWSKHNVPLDVWPEILSRLPVKSLVRFRCVSKCWRMLIDGPDFCHLHLNHFKNNVEETHLLFVQGVTKSNGFIRCSETFKTIRKLGCLGSWDRSSNTYRNTVTPGYNGNWVICFSVDGLVLLRSSIFGFGTDLMLWNPSIRKCRLVPVSRDTSSNFSKNVDLGVGFDPSIKDYKLVRVVLHENSVRAVAVYTVGTDSWKTIQFRGRSNGSWAFWSTCRTYALNSVYFRCSLCFISSSSELVSFDLSSEVFTCSGLPEFDDPSPVHKHDTLAVVDGGCSLAVFRTSFSGSSLWALENPISTDDTSLCWTKRCTISRYIIPSFFCLKRNGDLLGESYQQLISYNVEKQEEKILPKALLSKVTTQVLGYKESLVLLK